LDEPAIILDQTEVKVIDNFLKASKQKKGGSTMELATNDFNQDLRALTTLAVVDGALEVAEQKGEDQAKTLMFNDDLDAKLLQIQQANCSREEKITNPKALFVTRSDREQKNLATHDLFTATFSFTRGKIFNFLYDEVSKREKWGIWFEENFPGLPIRTANSWRALAYREDCHRHAPLGEARLLKLLPLTKNLPGEDPITEFLTAEGVKYDPSWETVPAEIKNHIDIVIRQALQGREKKVLRDFSTLVDKLVAKIPELFGDADSLKKVNGDKVWELVENLEGLIQRTGS
jgi:hypothetical protein